MEHSSNVFRIINQGEKEKNGKRNKILGVTTYIELEQTELRSNLWKK
jgi:hypothetical protein